MTFALFFPCKRAKGAAVVRYLRPLAIPPLVEQAQDQNLEPAGFLEDGPDPNFSLYP
ncbi:MAG: hypothetical protein PVG41_04035 [Desulfobacteraceae bacterium]|jgi:hypothetical protein